MFEFICLLIVFLVGVTGFVAAVAEEEFLHGRLWIEQKRKLFIFFTRKPATLESGALFQTFCCRLWIFGAFSCSRAWEWEIRAGAREVAKKLTPSASCLPILLRLLCPWFMPVYTCIYLYMCKDYYIYIFPHKHSHIIYMRNTNSHTSDIYACRFSSINMYAYTYVYTHFCLSFLPVHTHTHTHKHGPLNTLPLNTF